MKYNKYIMILLPFLAAVGCQVETDMPGLEDAAKKMKFTAILEDVSATRTYLGEEEEGQFPVYWNEGDKIKMFVSQHEISDGQGYQLDLESGAGTVESVFSGDVPELPEGSLYYYAVYPYSLAASIGGGGPWDSGESSAENTYDPEGNGERLWELANYVQIPLPSVQKFAPHSFGRDYNPAIAVSRDQTLRFKNVCGLLRINLTGNVKVGRITVQGDGEAALWGVLLARYRWRQNSSESEISLQAANGQSTGQYQDFDRKLLTLDCGEGVQLTDEPNEFYLVLPVLGNMTWDGGDYYDFKYKSVLADGFTIRIYDSEGIEVFAQHTEKDNNIVRSMIRNMPVLDIRRQSLTDLSVNGTANSYIVSPDGNTYRFFAGNRGNSPQPINENGPVAIQDAVVQVLWETRMSGTVQTGLNDILDEVSFDPQTQYISFKTTSNPGNALIALKDAADNILWSWHIWSTDYNPEESGNTDKYGAVEMMDRNLGALQKNPGDVSFYGLYYQWGRKDPFDAGYALENRKYLFYPTMPFSHEDGPKPEEEIIRKPTTYFASVSDFYDMDLSDIALRWGKNKTMHDPCPPGWQVADFDTFYQFASSFSSPSFGVTDYGDYKLFTPSTPDAVYPSEAIWTSLHHRTFWGAVSFQIGSFGKGQYSSGTVPVRCQRSNHTLDLRPVIDLSEDGTANCYMARPRNKYKFNASVKGNSDVSTGMPANAVVEYFTENTNEIHGTSYGGLRVEDFLISDCFLKDGYIYFTTSLDDVYGNATIVLKDPQGKILWSWHIWIVDYDPEANYDLVNLGVPTKMMKMNLGALNNTMYDSRAMGMMYQWGRKDPFLGAVFYDSNSQVLYSGTHGSVEASNETSTLFYSLRNPAMAIMDEADGDGDWLIEHENALWGEEKTMYDPCPRGWKVPSRPVFQEHSVESVYQYGMQMDGVWYPATGFRHSVSFNLNRVGQEGHYWYVTPKDDGHAYSFFFDSDNQTVDLTNHDSPKAQLNAIRCVEDAPHGEIVVND